MKLQQRCTIIGLGVENLEKSRNFYEKIFGWEPTKDSTDTISFYQLNGSLLSIYPREKLAEDATVDHAGSGFRGVTLAYNTHDKAEVDAIFQHMKANEVQLVKLPEEVFWGGYSGYIADPDGHLWEVAYNPYMNMDKNGMVQ